MMGYYDLVLGLIPVVLAGLSGALAVAGVSLTVAIPLASLVCVGLIGHAMFVRTPVTPSPPGHDGTGDAGSLGTAD